MLHMPKVRKHMLFIGITGGVGAGKSEILNFLRTNYNSKVMLTDEIAHDLMEPGTDCYSKLKELFAPSMDSQSIREKSPVTASMDSQSIREKSQVTASMDSQSIREESPVTDSVDVNVYNEDGTFNRSNLAKVIFTDEAKRDALNAIVHPAVKQYVVEQYHYELEKVACAEAKKELLEAKKVACVETGMELPRERAELSREGMELPRERAELPRERAELSREGMELPRERMDRPEESTNLLEEGMPLDLLVVESALLIDDNYGAICEEMWYIYTSEENRRARLKASRGYSDEKIQSIFDSQLSEEEFRRHCVEVIDNNGTTEESFAQIRAILERKGIYRGLK